ncbi:MAG: hypothetical protein APF81_06140 [Desulfosporosinus sp. BRH_c37]|nr:MAG: hypothetical protein APF81_06140 [Desulfosporosinus sp. BRH_c37]
MSNIPLFLQLPELIYQSYRKKASKTFIITITLKLMQQIRDHAQAYTVLDKVDAYNVSNKAKLDYSHDSVEKEYDLNPHVQNHKHDIFPTFTLPPTPCVFPYK